ncbi:lipase family protein [Paenibacillus sp. DYY-L-2]|uniref:lipase family protein n=1 Tax=Paenibacillus sp. DYY-L-2 TaxID=3447013 RepID=UPI003F4F6208
MNYTSDQDYHTFSSQAYVRASKNGEIVGRNQDWEITTPVGTVLHDTNGSGFDATIFKNINTDEIVIAYRGTEPPGRPLWSMLVDYETDGMDVVGGRMKNLEEFHESYEKIKDNPWIMSQPDAARMYHKLESDYQTNQFRQAEVLYETVAKTYPNSEITTTGHSLGGALAEYVAVRNGLSSTSFNAPSINHLLSDELREKSERGDFDKTNVAYVDPGDSIGSGLADPDRHAGSTYYTYSTYEEANKKYQDYTYTYKVPLVVAVGEPDFWNFPKFKIIYVPVTRSIQSFGVFRKMYNSISGEARHGLDRFTFDDEGNISNDLFTMDGQRLDGSPRWNSYEESLRVQEQISGQGTGIGMSGIFSTVNGTIQLRPEALKEAGQILNRHVLEFQGELPAAIRTIQRLVESSSSRSLQPIVISLIQTLHTFNNWYVNEGQQIADYINKKADDFIRADRG